MKEEGISEELTKFLANKSCRRKIKNKADELKYQSLRKNKHKRYKKQYTITLIVSLILISSVFLIVIDSIKKSSREQFHSFYDNKYGHKYMVRGVDVSHHNGSINWMQLKNEGIAFAYIKATEGLSHKDRKYKDNYTQSKYSDIKVGTYHFYTFGLDGMMQAQHFIRHSTVGSGDLIPAIDVEHSPVNKYSNDKDYNQKVLDELIKLEKEMYEYYGVHPVIYTNQDCYKLYIKSRFPDNLIWMSNLHNEPVLNDNEWVIWQFSHTGTINGANGDIDLNYFRHSFRQFNQLLMP